MRSINSPAELPADFGMIDGEDHPDTVIANAATAIERERCAKIAEADPELPGDMPDELRLIPLEDAMRAAVRATKKSIAAAIRKAR